MTPIDKCTRMAYNNMNREIALGQLPEGVSAGQVHP